MISLADRLKAAMAEAGVSQAELARACGVKPPSINGWLSGKSKFLRGENLLSAARTLHVEQQWLATGVGRRRINKDKLAVQSATSDVHLTAIGLQNESSTADRDFFVIPQYEAGGSMGKGLVLQGEQPGIIRSMTVTQEWATKNLKSHTGMQNLCIVTGFGDSMRPMFNPGDPLILDQGVTSCEVDAVYYFRVEDQGFIKRLQRIPGEGIRVISANKDYETWTIKQGADFEVFGRVMKAWRSEDL